MKEYINMNLFNGVIVTHVYYVHSIIKDFFSTHPHDDEFSIVWHTQQKFWPSYRLEIHDRYLGETVPTVYENK